uniref:palmitoyltransferase ZDHHC11-like n=1 Tax=Euleptes europaea TaxID=460621 RepID=UPI00254175E7|nr:palmitoyltransferase ZDHHC11-like [Euleptes europaea]
MGKSCCNTLSSCSTAQPTCLATPLLQKRRRTPTPQTPRLSQRNPPPPTGRYRPMRPHRPETERRPTSPTSYMIGPQLPSNRKPPFQHHTAHSAQDHSRATLRTMFVRRVWASVLQMICFDEKLRRTGPEEQNGHNGLTLAPPHSRVNGWSLPLHSFQVVTLGLYAYLAIIGFGIYIPLLPHGWKYVAYTVIGLLFMYHLINHLVAVTIDPADQNVLAKKNYNKPMPIFDRSKCKHVIQNQRCYLCEVEVGPKVKHCSTCNKCIADFDHHCNWLNNCVGSKNYWFFFNAVASAVLGLFLLMLVVLYVVIQYFVNPAELRTSPQFESVGGNDTWLVFLPVAPAETTAVAIMSIAVLTLLLGLASFLLLGHLLLFHLYLLVKKLSTYEYMTRHRPRSSTTSQEMNVVGTFDGSSRMEPLQDLSEVRQPKHLEVAVLPASERHPFYLVDNSGPGQHLP